MKKLPIYQMIISEDPNSDVEVSFVALVDKPAIEKNFMAFSGYNMNFAADPSRQIISGPAMIADSLIYRRDESGEYNVYFSKETIQEIALKFFKKDYQKNLNLFHDPSLSLQGVTIFESFISDKSRGIQPMKGFEDLPDGTWFISAKVENPIVWDMIKTGAVKGFSVEGIFSYMKKPKSVEDQIFDLLNGTLNANGHFNETESMKSIKELVAAIKAQCFDLPAPAPAPAPLPAPVPVVLSTDYKLKDGTAVTIDKLEAGGVVLIAGVPAPAGEHELEDGTKITVGEGGLISAVAGVEPMEVPPLTMAEVSMAINTAITTAMNDFKVQMAAERLAAQTELSAANTTIASQDKKINGLFSILEQLSELPTADPVDTPDPTFFQAAGKTKHEKRAELAANLKKLRSKN